MSNKKLTYYIYIIIILIILFSSLNAGKFFQQRDQVIPVWSGEDEEYYSPDSKQGFITRVREMLSPRNILYHITRVKINVPISYLKKQIPLLGYYTPQEIKEPEQRVYNTSGSTSSSDQKVIKLAFDLREKKEEGTERVKTGPRKSILIYHTHTSETYIDDPRNQDDNGHVLHGNIGNVGKVGYELASTLSQKYDYKVIHSTEIHDQEYMRSYYNSRKTVKNVLQKNNDLDIVLDIHRDGVKNYDEETYTTTFNNQRVAKIMIVVTNGRFKFANLDIRNHHTEWQRNLHFARKLGKKMEEMYPGLLKRIEVRETTYNQDLHPHAVLLEIGDYNNNTGEAVRSAKMLADVLASLDLS